MASSADLEFKEIVPRGGSQHGAFEELCCQLAYRTVPENTKYVRIYGAGGDGGVECWADLSEGARVGWQAKYVFDISSLLRHVTQSLETALEVHPQLSRYIVCFPFDLTGPTRRQGQSSSEKFNDWRQRREEESRADGRQLAIEAWPASELRRLLLQHDPSGGVREFFFNRTVLTDQWFLCHLETVEKTAGPRYTAELTVKTDLHHWFGALGRTAEWSQVLAKNLQACHRACERLSSRWRQPTTPWLPAWPENVRAEVESAASKMTSLLASCADLASSNERDLYECCLAALEGLLDQLSRIESLLVNDLEAKHGRGTATAPGFRQYMAEYMNSFPAANLDDTRRALNELTEVRDWLQSPMCSLAYTTGFALTGVAGTGKTHGVCDVARGRFKSGLLTCIVFGHEFRGAPDPWTRLAEALGLPSALGRDGILDALNAAGEASGQPLLICIDALNETRPLRYWHDQLAAFAAACRRRAGLRLVVTCRTSYSGICLPDAYTGTRLEHVGFANVQREACVAFFEYYQLVLPIAPILQPEMANPLYLRLLCETLQSKGLRQLPAGWRGLAPTIRAFLQEKERSFAVEHGTTENAGVVVGSLAAVARRIAEAPDSALPASEAQRVIVAARPRAAGLPVLDWLIREELLIEDAPAAWESLDDEGTVRPAFERLGDFLIASELLDRAGHDVRVACEPEGALSVLWREPAIFSRNRGVLSALSILMPERHREAELPLMVDEVAIRRELLEISIRAFPHRHPKSFSRASVTVLEDALRIPTLSAAAMDAVLSAAWQPSAVDAQWIHARLTRQSLARRDAAWCRYLHESYESKGVVRKLVDAVYELPLNRLDADVAARWSTVLFWFTAAADRRVKDEATRAATAILAHQPAIVLSMLTAFIRCDDDEIRERVLVGSYGALINSRATETIAAVVTLLHTHYVQEPTAFGNALIRDHIRCIAELAHEVDALPNGVVSDFTMQSTPSPWPLALPADDEVDDWSERLHFRPDDFISDFFKYSMDCLDPWLGSVPKVDMGKWILQRVARDFNYVTSECEHYDEDMLGKYGGGRGKPTWAERIGKKYMWLAMYQLASRLHDHAKRQDSIGSPPPLRKPLILLEERKLDSTLPRELNASRQKGTGWWLRSIKAPDLDSASTDEHWVAREDDVPTLADALRVTQHDEQQWRLLVSYATWDLGEAKTREDDSYRQMWMHIKAYLVPSEEGLVAWKALHRRNFFGRWMPDGALFPYGFVGEYPWATPFNTEPDDWQGRTSFENALPFRCEPSWNELLIEWEYDATLHATARMLVPARSLLVRTKLWWDGRDGYGLVDGKTFFRDPSVTEGGPSSLVADSDGLGTRLDRLGMSLVWIAVGEKWILGGHQSAERPRRTFSQIARLQEDGSLQVGDRVFFDDLDYNRGPAGRPNGIAEGGQ